MSWEDQGRQWHGYFGTGSGPSAGDVAAGVVREAVGLLPAARRGAFGRYLAEGGAGELAEAIPVWAGASGLDGRSFRRLVVGPVLGVEAAASLQALGVAFAAGDIAGATARLADAVGSEASGRWARGLGYARDQAVYSAVNGRVPGGEGGNGDAKPELAKEAPERITEARSVVPMLSPIPGPLPDVVLPGTRDNEGFVRGVERTLQSIGDAIRGIFHSDTDKPDDKTPVPRISPSAGTGTPDPEDEPDNDFQKKRSDAIRKAKEALPSGMTLAEFGSLVEFEQGQSASAGAATEASEAVLTNLRAAGVNRNAVEAMRNLYRIELERNKANLAAQQRVQLLENILQRL